MKKYHRPNLMTPSYVILYDPKMRIKDGVTRYVFATQIEAKDYWFRLSGRLKNEAHIEKRKFSSKAAMMRDINETLGETK